MKWFLYTEPTQEVVDLSSMLSQHKQLQIVNARNTKHLHHK